MMQKKSSMPDHRVAGAFIILTVIVMPFIFPLSTFDPALFPRLLFLSVVLIATIIYISGRKFWSNNAFDLTVFRRLIFSLYAGYFIICGLSIAVATNIPEAFIDWMKTGAFFIFLALSLLMLQKLKEPYVFLTKTITVFSLMISVAGIYQFAIVAAGGELSHESTYLIRIPFGHRNLLSEIMFLCLPFTGYGIYRFRYVWRITCTVASILSLGLVTLLLAKSAWVAVILGSIIALATLFNYYHKFEIKKNGIFRLLVWLLTGSVVIVIAMIIYTKADSSDTLKKQTDWISNYRFGSSLERVDLWNKTLQMYRNNPLLGVGGGNWKIVLPEYKIEDIAAGDNIDRAEGITQGRIIFQRPHNDFLWALSETGLPGFLLYTGIFFVVFYYIFSFIKRSVKNEEKYFMLFMLFGLTGYIIISLVSFPKERIDHSVFIHLLIAVVVLMYHRSIPVKKPVPATPVKIISAFGLLLSVGVFITSIEKVKAEIHSKNAVHYFFKSDWNAVISEADNACSFLVNVDNTSTPFKWYTGSAYFHLGMYDKAFDAFKIAYHYNPWHIHVLNNLATCYEKAGNHKLAEKYYNDALMLSPHFEDAIVNLCIVYYNTGRLDKAYTTIKEVNLTSTSENYHIALDAILKLKIQNLISNLTERDMKFSAQRISNSPEWFEKVFRKSIVDKNTYERQVMIEAVYLMEVVDKSITSSYATQLNKKYRLMDKYIKKPMFK